MGYARSMVRTAAQGLSPVRRPVRLRRAGTNWRTPLAVAALAAACFASRAAETTPSLPWPAPLPAATNVLRVLAPFEIPVEDANRSFPVGAQLLLFDVSDSCYIGIVRDERTGANRLVAIPRAVAGGGNTAWITNEKQMIMGLLVWSCPAFVTVRKDEKLQLIGGTDAHYTAVLERHGRQALVEIPRDAQKVAVEKVPGQAVKTAHPPPSAPVAAPAAARPTPRPGLVVVTSAAYSASAAIARRQTSAPPGKHVIIRYEKTPDGNQIVYDTPGATTRTAAAAAPPPSVELPAPPPVATQVPPAAIASTAAVVVTAVPVPVPSPAATSAATATAAGVETRPAAAPADATNAPAAVPIPAPVDVPAIATQEVARTAPTADVSAVESAPQAPARTAARVVPAPPAPAAPAKGSSWFGGISLFVFILFGAALAGYLWLGRRGKAPAGAAAELVITPNAKLVPKRDEHGDMEGRLEVFPLVQLVEFYFGGKDSGTLAITDEEGVVGRLVFSFGHIIDADYKGRFGLAAAEALMRLPPTGTFRFATEDHSKRARVIEENTMVLLMRMIRGE